MKVTTILPTYRRPKMLERAIRSVLNQTYSAVQVLVLDDASGDETRSIVEQLAHQDPRVIYHFHEQNIGPDHNWIYGVDQIDTPFFSFLSDDDFLLPNFYENAINTLDKHPEAMFFCGVTYFVNNDALVLLRSGADWIEGLYTPPNGFVEMIPKPPSQNGILFRRNVIEKIDYRTPVTSFDNNFILQASLQFAFYVAPTVPCAVFHVHGNNTWQYSDVDKAYVDALSTMARILYMAPPEVRPQIMTTFFYRNYGALKSVFWKKIQADALDEAILTAQTMQAQNRYKLEADILLKFSQLGKQVGLIRWLLKKYPEWRAALPYTQRKLEPELLKHMENIKGKMKF